MSSSGLEAFIFSYQVGTRKPAEVVNISSEHTENGAVGLQKPRMHWEFRAFLERSPSLRLRSICKYEAPIPRVSLITLASQLPKGS